MTPRGPITFLAGAAMILSSCDRRGRASSRSRVASRRLIGGIPPWLLELHDCIFALSRVSAIDGDERS